MLKQKTGSASTITKRINSFPFQILDQMNHIESLVYHKIDLLMQIERRKKLIMIERCEIWKQIR